MGGNEYLHSSVSFPYGNQFVPFLQRQGADAVAAKIPKRFAGEPLDCAAACDHHKEPLAGGDIVGVDHSTDSLTGLHRENVDDIASLCGLAGRRNLITLPAVYTTHIGEE